MPDGREYELKFELRQDAIERLISHPTLRPGLPERQVDRLISTYFDTPDCRLHRERMALRVRQSACGTTQTLKAAGRSAVDRDEWEAETRGTRPELEWLRSTPLASVFADEAVAGALEPRFTVDVERTAMPLARDGTLVEVAIDRGSVRARNLSLAINEIELELKRGTSDGLMELARDLVRDLPLTLSLASKAERGYAVADLSWGQPTKDLPIDLADATTIADVFQRVVQACLHTLSRNAALVTGGSGDVEAVHKTRIALRHLRAALVLFRPVLRRKTLKRLSGDVKWFSKKLGQARDADVFQDTIFDEAAARDEPPGAPAVADVMRELQVKAHVSLQAALEGARWRLLLLDLLAFSTDGVRRRRREQPCAPFVRDRLRAHRRAIARRTRGWADRTESEMHDVRKRAKMLRYDLDLLKTLPKLGGKRRDAKTLNGDLHELQQVLGTLHDRVAMRERLDEVILGRPAPIGTSPTRWEEARAAAADLAAAEPDGDALRERAGAAARRIRRNNAFEGRRNRAR